MSKRTYKLYSADSLKKGDAVRHLGEVWSVVTAKHEKSLSVVLLKNEYDCSEMTARWPEGVLVEVSPC